jgi:hypothetical protein
MEILELILIPAVVKIIEETISFFFKRFGTRKQKLEEK